MSRGEGRTVPENRSLLWSDFEPLSCVLAGQPNVPTVGAAVQGVARELPPELQWPNEAAMGTQRRNYYPSQSAKSLLQELFELNPPTHLDPTHQTRISVRVNWSSSPILFEMQLALASYGMLEDLLVKFGFGNFLGWRPAVAGRSLFPSQCGSTVVQSGAPRSQYSPTTVRDNVQKFTDQVGGMKTGIILFVEIDVPLS